MDILKWTTIFATVAFAADDNGAVIRQGFEELGQLAIGVSYGHLHAFIETQKLVDQAQDQAYTIRRLVQAGKDTIDKWEKSSYEEGVEQKANAKVTSIRYQGWLWAVNVKLNELVTPTIDIARMMEDPAHHVDKRQALAVAATVEATAAFGFAMYNNKRIGKLETAVDQNAETLARFMKTTTKLFNHTREDISMLLNRTRLMQQAVTQISIDQATEGFMADIDMHLALFEARATKWRRGLLSLLQGRVTPDLIEPKMLELGMKSVEVMAKKRGLKVLHPARTDLYQFEVTVVKKPGGVRVFVHVPVTKGDVLDVYKHVPIDHLDKVKNVVYSIETERDVLAMNQANGKSLAMTLAELNRCRRVNQLYYCDHQRVLDRDQTDSCVGAMFAGIKDSVMQRCPIKIKKVTDIVQAVNHTTFRVVSTKGSVRVYLECEDDYVSIDSGEEITLQPGCAAQTQDHWFVATTDLDSAREIIVTPVLNDGQVRGLNLTYAMRQTFADNGELVLTAADIQTLADLESQVVRIGEPTWIWLWIFITLIAVAVAVSSFVIYRRLRGKSQKVARSVKMSDLGASKDDINDSECEDNPKSRRHSFDRTSLPSVL